MSTAPAKKIFIGQREVSETAPVYILAEMACAHQGDPEMAVRLIDTAAEAGADGIQLELFDAPYNMAPHSPMYETIEKLQFSTEVWRRLFEHVRSRNLDLFAFVYDQSSFELAAELEPDAYKLNSSDLSNPELLKSVAQSGKPFTLGTGASTLREITRSLKYVLENGGENVILMHGVQNFPTPMEDASIGRVELLRREFDVLAGYADHTSGDDPASGWVDLMAIGAGACLLEKHIVLDRSAKGVDWQAALEPAEFTQYIHRIRTLGKAAGTRKQERFSEACLKYRRFQKKVAVARESIKENEVFKRSKIIYLRHPDPGLSPFDMEPFFGRRAARNISAYEAITSSDIGD